MWSNESRKRTPYPPLPLRVKSAIGASISAAKNVRPAPRQMTNSMTAAISAAPTGRSGCSISWRLAMSRADLKAFFVLMRLTWRIRPVSRITISGTTAEARRSGSIEESSMTATERTITGRSTQGFSRNSSTSDARAAAAQAAPQPASTAIGASVSASSHVSRPKTLRICRLVAPTARSMAISSRLRESVASILLDMPTQQATIRLPSKIPSSRS